MSVDDALGALRTAMEKAIARIEAEAAAVPEGALAPWTPAMRARAAALIEEAARPAPPVRTVHHLACTGGTLISRCLAALPDVRLLSEVDPLSPLVHKRPFVPTDVVGLAKLGARPPEREGLIAAFLGGFEALYDDTRRARLALVLRDHAHSHFHTGRTLAERPSLREIIGRVRPLRSVVTVRHPLDAWLSLKANGWTHFQPATLDEYARRWLAFLDRHEGLEIVRYEDFTAQPEAGLRRLCAALELDYDPRALTDFAEVRLSGDSGRRGDVIRTPTLRRADRATMRETEASASYAALLQRLGYERARQQGEEERIDMSEWHRKYTPPPLEELRRVGSPSWESFVRQSDNIAGFVEAKLRDASLGEKARVLDFGAGVGRVALRLHARASLPTHACDINGTAMRYLAEQLPEVACRTTGYEPPLPYDDATFDAVYSISIWTHLPPDLGVAWLEEMRRILKPGGVALISFSGPKVIDVRRKRGDAGWESHTVEELRQEGLLYHEYRSLNVSAGSHPGVTRSYGLTAHHPDHVRKVWGAVMPVEAIHETSIDNIQDLAVLRKAAPAA